MISLRELQRMAFEQHVPEQMIERDYVLTWMLGSLAVPNQRHQLVANIVDNCQPVWPPGKVLDQFIPRRVLDVPAFQNRSGFEPRRARHNINIRLALR